MVGGGLAVALTETFWQCPLLAPSVHGLQMVWECVCVCVCEWNELEVCSTLAYLHIGSFRMMAMLYTSTRTHTSSNHLRTANWRLKVDLGNFFSSNTPWAISSSYLCCIVASVERSLGHVQNAVCCFYKYIGKIINTLPALKQTCECKCSHDNEYVQVSSSEFWLILGQEMLTHLREDH